MDIKEMEARLGPRRTIGTLAADIVTLHREEKTKEVQKLLLGLNQHECLRLLALLTNCINQLTSGWFEAVKDHMECHDVDPKDEGWSLDAAFTQVVKQLVSHADMCGKLEGRNE
jgi:hypothetical protein